MLLLVCFALAYALTGAMTQVGRDAGGGLRSVKQRAWSAATRRVANMRAGGPRDAGWWLWLAGASVYYTARTTVRGSRVVGRSVRTGWSAGWQRGKDRYEQRAARRGTDRSAADHDTGPFRTFADRWRTTRNGGTTGTAAEEPTPATEDHEDESDGPDQRTAPFTRDPEDTSQTEPSSGTSADGPMTLSRCETCGVFAGEGHTCTADTKSDTEPSDADTAADTEVGALPTAGSERVVVGDLDQDGLRLCRWCRAPATYFQQVYDDGWRHIYDCHACPLHVRELENFENKQVGRNRHGSIVEVWDGNRRVPIVEVEESAALAGRTEGSRQGAGVVDGTGYGSGGVAVANVTGEAPNIEAARNTFQELRKEAEQTVSRVDQLAASLQQAKLDPQTLGEVANVLEAADGLKASVERAYAGMNTRHSVMEEAVNSTPHAASTEWYKH